MTWTQRLQLLGSTRICYAPEGAPTAPADPGPTDDGDNTPEDPPPAGLEAPPPQPDPHAPPQQVDNDGQNKTRPKDLPDQFWDARTGTVRLDGLVKSYNDTKSMVGAKEETLRAAVRAEVMAELAPAELPKDADGYTLDEATSALVATDDPLLAAFRAAAFENKMSPAAFQAVVSQVVKANPPPDPVAETAALGENAAARIDRVSKFVTRHIKDPVVGQLAASVATTADGVRMIEALMGVQVAENRIGNDGVQGGVPAPTWAEVKAQMMDDRYQPGPLQDPAFIAKVDGMKQRYFAASGRSRAASNSV
jgi:hypothetical protein